MNTAHASSPIVALVVETLSEDRAAKPALFADLGRRVPPHIPVGSNSAGDGIDEMSAGLTTTDRMRNVHDSDSMGSSGPAMPTGSQRPQVGPHAQCLRRHRQCRVDRRR